MNEQPDDTSTETRAPSAADRSWRPGSRVLAALAVIAALAVGAGADAIAHRGRGVTYVALAPAPISTMTDDTMVAVTGTVAETFGNKFIVADSSGRALVETGRGGEDTKLVARGETVTVQGRFEHGFIHALAIRHADGRSDALDLPPPPPPGGRGPLAPPL